MKGETIWHTGDYMAYLGLGSMDDCMEQETIGHTGMKYMPVIRPVTLSILSSFLKMNTPFVKYVGSTIHIQILQLI